jgi:hypothetical protein
LFRTEYGTTDPATECESERARERESERARERESERARETEGDSDLKILESFLCFVTQYLRPRVVLL